MQFDQLKRREFIALLGGAAAAWPVAARAQPPAMPVIGSHYGVSAAEWAGPHGRIPPWLERNGLCRGAETSPYRWADGQFDRMPAMAADLIGPEQTGLLFYARMLYFARAPFRGDADQ
jgi:putative tryptophan/tyrosine transport system substrate-binding protein